VSEHPSATATFLFTDIEGSTQLATRLRDGYPEVLAKHHELLEGVFAAHGGTVVDTQGDAFFVAFTRPRDAVEAAADVQRTLAGHTWPEGVAIRVRIGVHTGEANVAGERYVGLTVHRAARISAIGHGGQVLVSQTTASLLEDDIDHLDDLALRDLGEYALKDIARPIRVYQLDVEGLPTQFPPLKAPRPERGRSRLRIALVAAAALVAGALAVGFVLMRGDAGPPEIVPNSLVRYDPETLEPTDVIPIGAAPDFVVAAGDYVWITHYVQLQGEIRKAGDHNLTRVDTRTNEAVVVGGGLSPCGLAADPSGDVWVANCYGPSRPGTLVRVGANDLRFKATWSLPPSEGFFRGLAYGGGSLWVSDYFGPNPYELAEVDARTGRRKTILMTYETLSIAWSEYGDLWALHPFVKPVTRLRAATSQAETFDIGLGSPEHLAIAGDVVWAGDGDGPEVARAQAVGDPRPRVITLAPSGGDVEGIAADDDAAWATVPEALQLWRIDAQTNATTQIDIPYFPVGVAVGKDAVWVTVRDKNV